MTTHDEMRSPNGLPASRGGKGKLALLATLLSIIASSLGIVVFVLNHQKQDAQNSASDLSRQKIELESNIQALKSQQNALQDKNSQLQKQGDDLRNRIDTLSGQLQAAGITPQEPGIAGPSSYTLRVPLPDTRRHLPRV